MPMKKALAKSLPSPNGTITAPAIRSIMAVVAVLGHPHGKGGGSQHHGQEDVGWFWSRKISVSSRRTIRQCDIYGPLPPVANPPRKEGDDIGKKRCEKKLCA